MLWSPDQSSMGRLWERMIESAVRKAGGHVSNRPSGVSGQLWRRINSPISPPLASASLGGVEGMSAETLEQHQGISAQRHAIVHMTRGKKKSGPTFARRRGAADRHTKMRWYRWVTSGRGASPCRQWLYAAAELVAPRA